MQAESEAVVQPLRPSMTALLAAGAASKRRARQSGAAKQPMSKVDRMLACLEWRHAHLTSLEYPLEIAGVRVGLRQLMQGELTGLGTGATVWPAAHVLAKYLEKRWPLASGGMNGMRVVDLGAGTGAVGLAARVLGADVTLTDQEQLAFLMEENAHRTVRAMAAAAAAATATAASDGDGARTIENATPLYSSSNSSASDAGSLVGSTAALAPVPGVLVATYDWGGSDAHLEPLPFDVVIVSDCVLPKLYPIEPLVDALVKLTRPRGAVSGEARGQDGEDDSTTCLPPPPSSPSSPVVIMSYEHRTYQEFDPRERFEALASAAGLEKRTIPRTQHDDLFQAEDIELWEVRRRRPQPPNMHKDAAGDDGNSSSGVSWTSSEHPGNHDEKCVVLESGESGEDNYDAAAAAGTPPPMIRVRANGATFVLRRQDAATASAGDVWGELWASSIAMVDHLTECFGTLRGSGRSGGGGGLEGAVVLELGSGCLGVVALALASLGAAAVVATDKPAALPLLRRNLEANATEARAAIVAAVSMPDGPRSPPSTAPAESAVSTSPVTTTGAGGDTEKTLASISVVPFDWSEKPPQELIDALESQCPCQDGRAATATAPPLRSNNATSPLSLSAASAAATPPVVDYIVCADCVYALPSVEPLLSSLAALATPGRTKVLLANEQRTALDAFLAALRGRGFQVTSHGIVEAEGGSGKRPVGLYTAVLSAL